MELQDTPVVKEEPKVEEPTSKAALTPPTSEDMDKKYDSSSELSELNLTDLEDLEEDDDFEIEPDHYWGDGKIPVFKPTMEQFRSFPKFIDKIDKYGMKSGIVKVVAPKEWRDNLPSLDEMVKTIRVKNPIMQEFNGTHGTYTQANIEKQRSYSLPQWKGLTQELHHQPPAKRGERRKGVEAAPKTRATRSQPSKPSTPTQPKSAPGSTEKGKRRPGRPRKSAPSETPAAVPSVEEDPEAKEINLRVPPTPTSPDLQPTPESRERSKPIKSERVDRSDETPTKPRGRQPKGKSISSRRMNNRVEIVKEVDEAAFKNFTYKLEDVDQFTPERCQELEDVYWRTINYGQPMYGADMPGSLFDERTTSWNVAKLENLLDVLGTKVPGVNTAYLYLGMWKATFAWHLEDVDLYSINYIHFGAPKQWYSISQEDARRFEAAMKKMWPAEAKKCDQFLRHKTFLISPKRLETEFNIKVNKLVHYEGEFVITYPYGYHSGFNLGYNCAESVNFATEAWLNYGRIARKCDCEADSVWVSVAEIERKLRGEPTPEYYEETDDDEDDADEAQNDIPTPPASVGGKRRAPVKKRKRDEKKDPGPKKKKKKLRIRIKIPAREPCILCPNDVTFDDLLPTDNGQKAHRICAQYTVETFISEGPTETVCNAAHIDKARLDLKCNYCRSKRGSCFQCDARKCTRAYHATCAAAAGVLVDTGPMPYFDDDGQEYFYEGTDFRCRFHRPKRPKNADSETLENNKLVKQYAKALKPKDIIQAQVLTGDIFAGVVVENRLSESTVVIDTHPGGDHVEVEYKYLLVLDPSESQRPKPSSNAKPLPAHLNSNSAEMSGKVRPDGVPEKGDPFMDPNAEQRWEEFHRVEEYVSNKLQGKVDLAKPESLWFYLGKTSTEAKAQYTEDISKQRHNTKSNFLDTVKPPPKPVALLNRPKDARPRPFPVSYPAGVNVNALNGAMAAQRQNALAQLPRAEKPYQYKPRPDSMGRIGDGNAAAAYSFYASQLAQSKTPLAALQTASGGHAGFNSNQQEIPRSGQSSPTPSALNARSALPDRQVDPKLSKTQSPYRYYHQYYQPRSTQSSNPLKNPYQFPSNSPELQRRILPPNQNPTGTGSTADGAGQNSNVEDYLKHLKQYPYLLHCYLRRPKHYVSPYTPGGPFSTEWEPTKVSERAYRDSSRYSSLSYTSPYSSTTSTSRPGSSATGLGISGPSVSPTSPVSKGLQFQTPQQFLQDVARDQSQASKTHAKFEAFIQKLNSSSPQPTQSSKLAASVSLPPHLVSSLQFTANPTLPNDGSNTQSTGQSMTPVRPIPSPLSEYQRGVSPTRPEYSPLSDAGSAAKPSISASSGAETWRFT